MRKKLIATRRDLFKTININGINITITVIPPESKKIFSAVNPALSSVQHMINVSKGSGNVVTTINKNGVQPASLAEISKFAHIHPNKIGIVVAGTNLYWYQTDAVYYSLPEAILHQKHIPTESPFHNKEMFFLFQTNQGKFGFTWENPTQLKDYHVAIASKPILLNGNKTPLNSQLRNGLSILDHFGLESGDLRHVFNFPQIINTSGEKVFFGMKNLWQDPQLMYDAYLKKQVTIHFDSSEFRQEQLLSQNGLDVLYRNEYTYNQQRNSITFLNGLLPNKYPHNVLGLDVYGNLNIIQFNGLSGRIGPTLEEIQDILLTLGITDAIVTTNGDDVFTYSPQDGQYYSNSEARNEQSFLSGNSRVCPHVLIIER